MQYLEITSLYAIILNGKVFEIFHGSMRPEVPDGVKVVCIDDKRVKIGDTWL